MFLNLANNLFVNISININIKQHSHIVCVCTFVYVYVSVCLLWGLSVIVSVLHLPSCRAPKASACQFVGPLKSRLTGTDPERIKEM